MDDIQHWGHICRVTLTSLIYTILYYISFIIDSGLSSGIYTTNSPETCQYIIQDCKANVIIIRDDLVLQNILKVCQYPLCDAIIIICCL